MYREVKPYPADVRVYVSGESGRVGNRHFERKGLRNESLFFRIVAQAVPSRA